MPFSEERDTGTCQKVPRSDLSLWTCPPSPELARRICRMNETFHLYWFPPWAKHDSKMEKAGKRAQILPTAPPGVRLRVGWCGASGGSAGLGAWPILGASITS